MVCLVAERNLNHGMGSVIHVAVIHQSSVVQLHYLKEQVKLKTDFRMNVLQLTNSQACN